MFLQTLMEVWAKLRAKDTNHLFQVHLAEGVSIHGAVGQTEGTCIKLCALYMVTDPLQNIVCCPAVRANLPVPLTCRIINIINIIIFYKYYKYYILFIYLFTNIFIYLFLYCNMSRCSVVMLTVTSLHHHLVWICVSRVRQTNPKLF